MRQFLRLCRHTWIMGRQHPRRGRVGENQHRKRSASTEKNCFDKSHKYSSTGERTAELNIHLQDTFHGSGTAAIAKPLITESNIQMRKRWCHDKKRPWTSDNWTTGMDRWLLLHAVPYIRKSLRLENSQGSLQSGMPGSKSETRERFCDGSSYSWSHYYPSWPNYIKRVYGQVR
jgi:hypothetical protein